MYRPLLYLTVVVSAPSLQAQVPLGPVPGRAFQLIQQSQWIPQGVDPALAASADSGVIAVPVFDASKSFGKGLVELRITSPDFGVGAGIRVSRSESGGDLTILPDDPDRLSYTVDHIGSVYFDLPAWFGSLPLRPNGTWTDSLVYETVLPGQEKNDYLPATLPDTAWIRRIRRGRIEKPAANGWVWVRAETDIALTTTSRSDYDDDPLEVRRLDLLLGRWQERFLYDSAHGQVDSVTVTGRLAVLKEFTHSDGRRDTLTGELVIERTGRWESDGTAEAERRNAVFIVHGRDTTQSKPGPEPPYWSFRERLREGDTTAFEELIRLRAVAGSSEKRTELERILAYWTFGVAGHARRRVVELWRQGDPFFTEMATSYRYDDFVIDQRHARILVSTFGTLASQRTYPKDRAEGLGEFLQTMIRADSVTREAGSAFAQAAITTDDPIARKLFLLGAYRGDPAEFLAKVESVDTSDMFGRQVVAYAHADPNRPYSTGGGEFRDDATFPGLDATASRHLDYMKAAQLMPSRGVFGLSQWNAGMLREWVAAHDPHGVEKLRSRFRADTAWLDKSVWATYLIQLGDTLPLVWLRTLATVEDDSARARAYWVLELTPELVTDTLTGGPLLADLQNRLLQYATTGLGFGDSAELRPFSSHDERPDQRLLATENLVSDILANQHWQHRFEMLPEDSLRARAYREGLVMAFNISPVERILDRYYVDLNHSPYSRYGGGCLCGGGSMFVLEYRHGKWRVVSMGQWVS